MKVTINLDEDLLREAAAIHPGKSKTAVLELGLRELIYADQRKTLAAAFGSQPDLQSAPRRRRGSHHPGTRSDQAAREPTGWSVTNLVTVACDYAPLRA